MIFGMLYNKYTRNMFDLNYINNRHKSPEEQMRIIMRNNANIADRLYQNACKEIQDSNSEQLPNPVEWLYNQDSLRESWISYKDMMMLVSPSHELHNTMINNAFGKYMQFMYDTYPPNFGNSLKSQKNKK